MKKFTRILAAFCVVLTLCTFAPTTALTANTQIVAEAATKKKVDYKVTLAKSDSTTLYVYTNYTSKVKNVKWSSSNKKIATVSSKGKVVAKAKGTCYIYAKYGKKKLTAQVKVETPSISKKSVTVNYGKTYQLKLNGNTQSVSWKTSDSSVATVNSKGKVTAKGVGKATITVKVKSGKSYKCTVTVKDTSASVSNLYIQKQDTPEGAVAIVTNNNASNVYVVLSCKYYDYYGNMVYETTDYNNCLQSGRTAVFTFYKNNIDYARSEVSVKSIERAPNYLDFGVQNISYYATLNEYGDGLNVTMTNNSYKHYEYINYTVVFYDAYGNILSTNDAYAYCEAAGTSDTRNVYYPFDSNYNTIYPSRYEIYVNFAYEYIS